MEFACAPEGLCSLLNFCIDHVHLAMCYHVRYSHLCETNNGRFTQCSIASSFHVCTYLMVTVLCHCMPFYAFTTVRQCQRHYVFMSSVRLCVCPGCCFHDVCGVHRWIFTKLVSSASWDRDELVIFWGQKVKVTA